MPVVRMAKKIMSQDYLDLLTELTEEERRENRIREKSENEIKASQARQEALKLQLKAERYSGEHLV